MVIHKQDKVILLDTNIFQYSNHKYSGKKVRDYINKLQNEGYELGSSNICIAEILSGVYKDKETIAVEWIKKTRQYEVDILVLNTVGYISRVYNDLHIPIQQIDLGDKIIAATAFLTNSYILTANYNDFPRPLFIEIEREIIEFDQKGKVNYIPIYVLIPDILYIKKLFGKLK